MMGGVVARRVLIVTATSPGDFSNLGGADPSLPRYHLNYALWGGLRERGFQVEFESLRNPRRDRPMSKLRPGGWWEPYVSVVRVLRHMRTYDIVVTLGTLGHVLSIAERLIHNRAARVVSVVYWNVPNDARDWRKKLLHVLYKWGVRNSGRVLLISRGQVETARSLTGCRPEKLVWMRAGVDTRYYRPASIPEEAETGNVALAEACPWRRYVVVSGDMLRQEQLLPKVLSGLGVAMVRLTQNTYVERFWHEQEKQGAIDFPVFCAPHLPHGDVRYAYQRALCLLNLVDNSWQPAGWTVMAEAMACGIPVIMNAGLSTEEMKADLNPDEALPIIEISQMRADLARVALSQLMDNETLCADLRRRARAHIEKYFTVEMSADMVALALDAMTREKSQ